MKKLELTKSSVIASKPIIQLGVDYLFDDACIFDMDYFVKTLTVIKANGVRPDLIGSIITNYASKWLPDLSNEENNENLTSLKYSQGGITALWMKKRFFIETLVGIFPPEKDSIPCNFLLQLLRIANMIGVEANCRVELEIRIAWQLDQASLKELMVPSFSHTCGTLLDVELIIRLVKRFNNLDEGAKCGAALVKVAKLVDSYLAEVAIDSNLALSEFIALAGVLPSHARITDDGLYRAIDTYLKVHPGMSKQERKSLCRLIDSRKLSSEASLHAAQNERLPIRAVIQVLFSEQTKFNHHLDWSGSFSSIRSPNPVLEPPVRCLSKLDVTTQGMEIRKLKEDVHRLQTQYNSMQENFEKLSGKNKGRFFKWRKLAVPLFRQASVTEKIDESEGVGEEGFEWRTPNVKAKLVKGKKPLKWKKSLS